MGYWILFFGITVGAKLVLALVMIYLLLPTDRSCSGCDEPTLPIRPPRFPRLLLRGFLGRVQWRWCPRCGEEGLARVRRPLHARPGIPAHREQPTRH